MAAPLKSLKWYKGLATGKGRREAGAFLVEGVKAITQITENHPQEIQEILSVGEPPATLTQYPRRIITESQCRYICTTQTPQGIMAVVRLPSGIYSDTLPENPGKHILLLDDIQDPGNAGTLIRTAAAFDFSGVIISGKSVDPLSPKCVQAATGTLLFGWIRRTDNFMKPVKELKSRGYKVIAADISGSDDLSALKSQDKILLALGNEAAGLSADITGIADFRLRIPISRQKAESLNVAVSGAILMYLCAQS